MTFGKKQPDPMTESVVFARSKYVESIQALNECQEMDPRTEPTSIPRARPKDRYPYWIPNEDAIRTKVLRGADMRRISAKAIDLRGADLRGANFQDANLQGVDFHDADLRGANLNNADLRGADLRDTDLRRAFLIGAGMLPCNLLRADLRGAHMTQTLLDRLVKSNAGKGVDDATVRFRGVKTSGANGENY